MSRRSRARWFHVAGPVLVLAVLAALAVWLGPGFRPRPDPPPREGLALLLLEYVTGPDGRTQTHRLLRVGMQSGEVTPVETVWEGEVTFFGYHGGHHLLDGRYVVSASSGVIDTWTEGVIHKPNLYAKVLDAGDGRVVYHTVDDDAVSTFDLRTRKDERTGDAAQNYALRGARSSDGTKWIERRGSVLVLHRVGQEPVTLGADFQIGPRLTGTDRVPAVLWLDDSRVLTQLRDGVLVVVALDGTRTTAVTMPIRDDVIHVDGVPAAQLYRDRGGRIVYECCDGEFLIDVDGRKWERYEWIGLGNDFEASRMSGEDGHMIRYQGREIGRCPCQPYFQGHVATTDGHIALLAYTVQPDRTVSGNQVRVWSAATGQWATAESPRPAYLIGWTK